MKTCHQTRTTKTIKYSIKSILQPGKVELTFGAEVSASLGILMLTMGPQAWNNAPRLCSAAVSGRFRTNAVLADSGTSGEVAFILRLCPCNSLESIASAAASESGLANVT